MKLTITAGQFTITGKASEAVRMCDVCAKMGAKMNGDVSFDMYEENGVATVEGGYKFRLYTIAEIKEIYADSKALAAAI